MRIAKLSLLAFGPFTNGELGFAPKPGVLDLVYGPNEAGKSTSLRALTALLYGIPPRTQDAHLHEMARMRVGATLVDHTGRSFSFVRRKGQKQTLLDGDDEPVSEQVLSGLLGSLDATMFRQMFGLDHERLRDGAEALLAGGGNVGESLFDAGTGARAIRSVLAELKLEADELFKPRGPTTKLQVAVKNLRERQKARKEAMLSPQTFTDQRHALSDARAQLEAHLARRQELLREKSKLDRALSVLPLLGRRERLAEERATLGISEPFDAREVDERAELEVRLAAEERECARLSDELSALTGTLETLGSPRADALDHELVRELEQRFGSYRKALVERPRRRGELEAMQAEIGELRARVGVAAGALYKLDTPARTRLRKRADEERALAAAELERERELARAVLELAHHSERVAALGSGEDDGTLEALIARVERDELVLGLPRLRGECDERMLSVQHGLTQLGLSLTPAELCALVLPEDAELERIERALLAEHTAREHVQKELLHTREKQRALAAERALLLAGGEVVTEQHLKAARALRAESLAKLVSALREGAPEGEPFLRQHGEHERHADELADRLRREASRTHTLVRIEHDELSVTELVARLEHDAARNDARAHELLAETAELCAPLALASRPGQSARPKLKKLEQLRERAGAARELEATLKAREAHASELARALGAALGAGEVESLDQALSEARALLRTRERLSVERREAGLREGEARLAARELGEALERLRVRRREFADTLLAELAGLGFPAGISADEALAAADDIGALERKEREADALKRALELLDRESEAFADELRALCVRHVPDATERPAAEAMAMLVSAHRTAYEAARERERTGERESRVREELRAKEHTLKSLEAERARRFAKARVDSFAGLREVEQRKKRAFDIDSALEQLDAQLAALSEGLTLAELTREVRAVDPDEARARLVALEAELEALGDEIDSRHQAIGGLAAGLEQLRKESGAVSLAEETEADLATVRALARRYAEVRLGHSLLSREVERYRAAHQGPVLARASALFPRLTLDRYQRLEVALDEQDQPTLVCVREGGKNVRVAGLSDGTRDQLYLALRIASIERYLDSNPPMPLLLDDAFVHFDDARSQAALSVLGELCARTQVIFFTHHARMLELAKKALGKDKVLVHELDPAHGVVRTRDNGPLFARV